MKDSSLDVFTLLAKYAASRNCERPAYRRARRKHQIEWAAAEAICKGSGPPWSSDSHGWPEYESEILDYYGYLLSLSRGQDPDIFVK